MADVYNFKYENFREISLQKGVRTSSFHCQVFFRHPVRQTSFQTPCKTD